MPDAAELFDLTGKVAIVSGAGSGIGRDFAITYAQAGAVVIATDRDEERANETAEMIAADGGAASSYLTDVADTNSVQSLADYVAGEYGKADILVNN
ncbi:MAG: SDR family NAD(P)-dependent oxidoreductase, partial [Rhodospirillales bacterium]|nr:SDR family NAD(P)-dependent oxidoreductase [Rhodospirillales bacterium]